MGKLRDGQAVTIRSGQVEVPDSPDDPDGSTHPIDVAGFRGRVDGAETYESPATGRQMIVVQADQEFGGGLTSVPVDRLATGGRTTVGSTRAYREAFARIFPKKGTT